MKTTLLLVFFCLNINLILHGQITIDDPVSDKKNLDIAGNIAKAHGIEQWTSVEEIQFSFNVATDTLLMKREWIWKPKTEEVRLLQAPNETISYSRKVMDSTVMKTDSGFINDKFWLLLPFNLIWDNGLHHIYKETAIAPISKKSMQQLTITYNPESGGYTPGDAYDLFFEEDYIIKEWVFRKSNTPKPTIITTCEDYEEFNGLSIAKTHQINGSNRKVYFSNILVK